MSSLFNKIIVKLLDKNIQHRNSAVPGEYHNNRSLLTKNIH